MTQKESKLTRREALAGVGAVGFATLGAASGRPPTGTGRLERVLEYTYAQSDTPWDLRVGWRRTVNGAVVGSSPIDGVVDVEAAGIRLVSSTSRTLPGDYGTASVGLRLDDPGGHRPGRRSGVAADRPSPR